MEEFINDPVEKQKLKELQEAADNLKNSNPGQYESKLFEVLAFKCEHNDDNLKVKELTFYDLASYYISNKNPRAVKTLIEKQIEQIHTFPKAKSAKIIKHLIDQVAKVNDTVDLQIEMCFLLIEWCKKEQRTFLRLRIQVRLAALYLVLKKYQICLELVEKLLEEIRKADDKQIMVEAQLIDAKIQYALENYAKAKASLTAARAGAHSIYVSPNIQADIDMMGGILHAAEKDYKTSYSYFFEAFEGFHSGNDNVQALKVLKYMLLSKIMTNQVEECFQVLNSKNALKFAGEDLEAMRAIAKCHSKKSIIQLKEVLKKYDKYISCDEIIKSQLDDLYNNLLEQNLFRIIEPYSRVQLQHIANKIQLNMDVVTKKLSELILDRKIEGTLDQGNGCLILFDDIKNDNLYNNSLELIGQTNGVVDKLFEKTKLIKN